VARDPQQLDYAPPRRSSTPLTDLVIRLMIYALIIVGVVGAVWFVNHPN
jgi:hypothetical protein